MKAGIDYTGIVVAHICHDNQGRFLLQKRGAKARDEQGRWDFGGGKLEFGEDIMEGLKRELKEEFNCSIIAVNEVLPPRSILREQNGVKTHWLILPYIVQVYHDEAKINEPEFIDEIGWFALDMFPQDLASGVPPLLAENQKYFVKYS